MLQTSSDGNQTTSTLSITLSRSDAGKYLSCKAYNHMSPSEALEDGWKLDIQCEYRKIVFNHNKAMLNPKAYTSNLKTLKSPRADKIHSSIVQQTNKYCKLMYTKNYAVEIGILICREI